MGKQSWRTGIYLTPDVIQKHPGYVERLRDEIGLDTVVIPFTGALPLRRCHQCGREKSGCPRDMPPKVIPPVM